MTLGERIKVCRMNAGLSQEKVAELVGVSRQAVTKWETDKSAPSTENLFKLAEIFGTTVDMILDYEKKKQKRQKRLRLRMALLVTGGYVLFYLIGRILWVPFENMTVIGWLTTTSPYAINDYLYGWLFSTNIVFCAIVFSIALSLFGKFRMSIMTYMGFVLGYILGYLFGPNPEGAAIGHGHYGWAIWGVTFLMSIVVGCIVEKIKRN